MKPVEDLSRIYALFNGAKSLVSILGPIYLLHLGFSLQAILIFFIMTAIVKVTSLFIVFPLASRYSPRLTMVLGVIVMAMYFAWFAGARLDASWLVILAALLGVANAFFYPSFRISFSLHLKNKPVSHRVSVLNNYTTLATAVAPAIGGVVASYVSVGATYSLAAGLFVVAAVLAVRKTPSVKGLKFDIGKIPTGSAVRDYFSNGSYSFSGLADLAVWPLYVALIIPSYAGIGLYVGFTVLVSVVTQSFVGKFEGWRTGRAFLYSGVVLNAVYNILRPMAVSVQHIIGLGFLNAGGSAMLSGAYGTRFYKNIHPKDHLEYLFAMELANSITWLVYFPILLAVSYVAGYEDTLRIGVLIVIPAVFGMLLMRVFKAK